MKLAYLVSAHTDPAHLKRLFSVLHEDADFYVHIDAKAQIQPFLETMTQTNVHFITERIDVMWGDISEVRYQMALIRACLKSGRKYDYIFFISGMDYPLWSNESITSYLEKKKGFNYLQAICITDHCPKAGYEVYRPLAGLPIRNQKLKVNIKKAARVLVKSLGLRKKLSFTIKGKLYKLYKGSSWWCITPQLAEYILKEYEQEPEITSYFHNSFCPAETLIQTIAFNSPFEKDCILSTENPQGLYSLTPLHYIEYRRAIRIFDETHFNTLMRSGKMFARKLVTDKSDKLMDMIDAERAVNKSEKTIQFTR